MLKGVDSMVIDEFNISTLNAKLLKVDIGTQEFTNSSEWLDGTINPTFLNNSKKFKKISLELAFKGDTRGDILNNISTLISKLIKEVVLTLEGYPNKYKCILTEKETEKTISKHMYRVKLGFEGYEFSNEVLETMNRTTSKTINVKGNMEIPAIVEVTPSIDLIDLTIEGVETTPIKIKNLKANKKIIIDGENALITVEGVNKFSDTELWGFPKLIPGENIITVDKDSTDINIKYKPRYI